MDARNPPAALPITRKAKARHWAITFPLGARTEPEVVAIFASMGPTHRTVFNLEKSSTGWAHVQGYAHFKTAIAFDTIKARLYEASVELPHWLQHFVEKDPGLPKYINYCRKKMDKKGGSVLSNYDSKPDAAGPKRQGKRTDISSFRDEAISRPLDITKEPEDIIAPMCKYSRFTSECQSVFYQRQPRKPLFCTVFWGPTSTGKTYRANELFKRLGLQPHEVYEKSPGDKWWCGYRPSDHRAVLVNEFRHVDSELNSMWLRLLDDQGYAMAVQTKGGSTFVNPEFVVFTSPFHPTGWISNGMHQGDEDDGQQYARRFDKIINCTKKYYPEEEAVNEAAHAALATLMEEFPADA